MGEKSNQAIGEDCASVLEQIFKSQPYDKVGTLQQLQLFGQNHPVANLDFTVVEWRADDSGTFVWQEFGESPLVPIVEPALQESP